MGDVGLKTALKAAAGSQSPEDFIGRVSATEKAKIPGNFQTYLRDRPQNIPGLVNRIDRRYAGSLSYRALPQGPATAMQFAPGQPPQPQSLAGAPRSLSI
jgi:hypothetical protein